MEEDKGEEEPASSTLMRRRRLSLSLPAGSGPLKEDVCRLLSMYYAHSAARPPI